MPFLNPADKQAYMEKYHEERRVKCPKIECATCTTVGRWRTPNCGVCVKAQKQRKVRFNVSER